MSSIQVLATEHVFERWNLFPHERSKIIKTLNSVETKSLIISGDRHKGGLYKKDSLVELTSSSLNKPVKAARISNFLKYIPEFIINFIPKTTRELLVEKDKLLTITLLRKSIRLFLITQIKIILFLLLERK